MPEIHNVKATKENEKYTSHFFRTAVKKPYFPQLTFCVTEKEMEKER